MLMKVNPGYSVSTETFDTITAYWSNPQQSLEWECLFVLPGWLKVWWNNFAGDQSALLCAVREQGELIGIAPLMGFTGGFLLMVVIMWLFQKSAPAKLSKFFGRLQIISAAFVAYSHGKNDGQMPIGLITMALVAFTGDNSLWEHLSILDPIGWKIIVVSAFSISFGTAVGGWRVIRTLGLKITNLRPVQGFAATTAAASVIEFASHFGIPVSTTHCVSTSIMGVGATKRLSAVRWGIAKDIVLTWILTFPACMFIGWLLALLLKVIL